MKIRNDSQEYLVQELKKEVESLKKENSELEKRNDDLHKSIKESVEYTKKLELTNEELKKQIELYKQDYEIPIKNPVENLKK